MSEQYRKQTEEDLARLRRMLRKVVSDDDEAVRRRLAEGGERRILDIACGECREAETLADFIAELSSPEAEIKLTGIDVREREIADAARRFGGKRETPAGGKRESDFLVGDASKLDRLKELGGDFDLVFLRHQNYWNGARTWEEIYDHALSKLDDEGRLVITSYFDKEHELALEAIQRLGGELIRTEFNPETRKLETPGKSVDRHVAVFRRKK